MEVSRFDLNKGCQLIFAGDKCMYRHALPPGFILKSDKKAADELAKKEQISLEDFLEVEVGPTFLLAHHKSYRMLC